MILGYSPVHRTNWNAGGYRTNVVQCIEKYFHFSEMWRWVDLSSILPGGPGKVL